MTYYIKVEDSKGVIKSYLRFNDQNTTYKVYELIVAECLQKGDTVKLLNEQFQVLISFQTNQRDILERK